MGLQKDRGEGNKGLNNEEQPVLCANEHREFFCTCVLHSGAGWCVVRDHLFACTCGFHDISESCVFAALPNFTMPNWGFPCSKQQYLQSLSSVQMLFSWNELELDVSKITYPSIVLFGIGQEIPQLLKTNRFPMQWCETSSSPQPPSLFFPNNREEWRKPFFKLLFLIRLKRCRGLLTSWSIMDVDSEEQVVSPHFSLSNAFRYYIFVGPNICKTFGAASHSPWG